MHISGSTYTQGAVRKNIIVHNNTAACQMIFSYTITNNDHIIANQCNSNQSITTYSLPQNPQTGREIIITKKANVAVQIEAG